MRAEHPNLTAYRATGLPMVERHLVWVTPRDVALTTGFWTGSEDRSWQVISPDTGATISRAYVASGSLMKVKEMVHPSGLDIHPWEIELSPLNAQVKAALESLDLKRAKVELHRLFLHFETRAQIAPARVWNTGTINTAKVTRGPVGQEAMFKVVIAPITRALTIGNPELLSDTIQSQRSGDRILRYIGPQGTRKIKWGGK